jgi:hypothetical protein
MELPSCGDKEEGLTATTPQKGRYMPFALKLVEKT